MRVWFGGGSPFYGICALISGMLFLVRRIFLVAACLAVSALSAITIELDYNYDTNDFFDQPGAKEAMRAVADFYEERIHDNLLEIDQVAFGSSSSWSASFSHPGTGALASIAGLVVPEDTIIVYVGGRNLGGSSGVGGPGGYSAGGFSPWFARIEARGQSGALDIPATDFGPWGGSLSFNTTKTWHFQLDGRPSGSSSDFVSVALHEMGHLLGIGTAVSWDDQIDGDDLFNGVLSVEAFGGPVPVDAGQGHWQDDGACSFPLGYIPSNPLNVLSVTYGSFGQSHAVDQIALMDPSSCTITSVTSLKVLTDLDMAALADVGWEVFQPLELTVTALGPGASSFTWPSSTGQSYTVQRTTDLAVAWANLSTPADGDGQVMVFSDPSPPIGQAFYQLVSSASAPAAAALAAPLEGIAAAPVSQEADGVTTASREIRMVEFCGEHAH